MTASSNFAMSADERWGARRNHASRGDAIFHTEPTLRSGLSKCPENVARFATNVSYGMFASRARIALSASELSSHAPPNKAARNACGVGVCAQAGTRPGCAGINRRRIARLLEDSLARLFALSWG